MMLLPLGSADEIGPSVTNRHVVLEKFRKVTADRGFREIATPVVEYASTFIHPSVGMMLQDMMKWFNAQGEIEVLRPDWTTAIARALGGRSISHQKWAYQGPIYDLRKPGLERHQAGIEIIDLPELLGEVECLLTAVAFLKNLEIGPVIIELAHAAIFDQFVQPLGLEEETKEKLRKAMHDKRKDEVASLVTKYGDAVAVNAFMDLIDAYGTSTILEVYQEKWCGQPERLSVLNHLRKLVAVLQDCGVDDVLIDLGSVKKMPYYSGTLFRGFIKANGKVCFSGGRYDPLYDYFGKKTTAVGLAFDVDVLADELRPEPKRERICLVATEDTLAQAEKLRQQFPNAIVDIRFSADGTYDRVVYVEKDPQNEKAVDAHGSLYSPE